MSDAHGLNPGFLRMAHELRNMILALFPLAGKPDARHSSSPAICRSKPDARASCRSAASARTAAWSAQPAFLGPRRHTRQPWWRSRSCRRLKEYRARSGRTRRVGELATTVRVQIRLELCGVRRPPASAVELGTLLYGQRHVVDITFDACRGL